MPYECAKLYRLLKAIYLRVYLTLAPIIFVLTECGLFQIGIEIVVLIFLVNMEALIFKLNNVITCAFSAAINRDLPRNHG